MVVKKQIINTKDKFIDYANQYGLEEARKKISDPKLVEEFVKAYCDKYGLDEMSVRDALKGIQKVDKNTSLSSKYTTICETIKSSINTNKASIKSAVGYSGETASHKYYLNSAIELLDYTRMVCAGNTYDKGTINSRIHQVDGYGGGSASLTKEYISGMTLHTSDMRGYIQSGEGVYKPVRQWYSTGTYSSGAYGRVYLHH